MPAVTKDLQDEFFATTAAPEVIVAEVSFEVGEATRACRYEKDDVLVEGPLRLETADGRLALEYSVPVSGSGSWSLESPWIPAQEFERVTGIRDMALGDGEWFGFTLYVSVDGAEDTLEGTFQLQVWNRVQRVPFDGYPTLRWCAGSQCDLFWCQLTTEIPDEECPGPGGATGRGQAAQYCAFRDSSGAGCYHPSPALEPPLHSPSDSPASFSQTYASHSGSAVRVVGGEPRARPGGLLVPSRLRGRSSPRCGVPGKDPEERHRVESSRS